MTGYVQLTRVAFVMKSFLREMHTLEIVIVKLSIKNNSYNFVYNSYMYQETLFTWQKNKTNLEF